MKKSILLTSLILCMMVSLSGYTQNNTKKTNTTTYILVRHAEKDLSDPANRNPKLTETGLQRSEKLAKTLVDVPVDYIFSTNYDRTLQTALPTAKSKNIEPILYDPRDLYNKKFQEQTKGKTTLIVGHSNTTPAFVNKIIAQKKYDSLDEKDYDKLFIITIQGDTATDIVLNLD